MQKRNSYFLSSYFFTQNFITSFIVDVDEDKLFGLKEGTWAPYFWDNLEIFLESVDTIILSNNFDFIASLIG